eukprot:Gregarina_sp_Poly_1__6246@NODE_3310_length_1192_cov_26_873778_g2100_i0_p1_GENE_NODE_3310_length_1192_cov_26_873778_g2100_i0NODE_3310_length_1192_cov_26_873778_g2100_i0_p1_ORF_typecomplete_len333_score26_38_NODE_3310_length_1192_cov_26_873778_g2100_i01201001
MDGPEILAQTRFAYSNWLAWPGRDSNEIPERLLSCSNKAILDFIRMPFYFQRLESETHKDFFDRVYPRFAGFEYTTDILNVIIRMAITRHKEGNSDAVDFARPLFQDLVYQYFKTTESQARLRSCLQNSNRQEDSEDRSSDDQWTPSESGATETTVSECYASKGPEPIIQILKRMFNNLIEHSVLLSNFKDRCKNHDETSVEPAWNVTCDHMIIMRSTLAEFLYLSIWHAPMPRQRIKEAADIEHIWEEKIICAPWRERTNADWKFSSLIEGINPPVSGKGSQTSPGRAGLFS